MTGPECDNDMNHHHARVSCHGDQIRHARDRIGGLRSRHELGKGIDLIIHHQQCGAPRIDVRKLRPPKIDARKLRHGFLLAGEAMLTTIPYNSSWASVLFSLNSGLCSCVTVIAMSR
jgi:hypothetical protein